jgi:hypothetical protein
VLKAATLRPGRECLEKGIVMEKNGDSTFLKLGNYRLCRNVKKLRME